MRYLWVDRLIEAPIESAWRVGGVAATDHRVEPVDGSTLVSFGVPWFAPAYRRVCNKALMRIDRIARELRV